MTRLPDYRLNPPDVDAPRAYDWATGGRPTYCESCGGRDGAHADECRDAVPACQVCGGGIDVTTAPSPVAGEADETLCAECRAEMGD